MRTLLKNGKIYDGTGSDPVTGDILIENDRILQIGAGIDAEADNVIDLSGKSVAPGFIDGHSHNDWYAIKEDPLPYFEPFLRQGITTFVSGNCGISTVGFEADSPYADLAGAGLFGFRGTTGKYGTVKEFLEIIDRHIPCNMLELAGHCTARTSVAGYENRPLTPEEEKRMLNILEKALQEGAAGLSLGLMYVPGVYSNTEEIRKVAELCVKYNKPLTVHPRAESKVSMSYPLLGRAHILRALDELVEISKGTDLKLQYSHAIFVGRSSFRYKDEFLRILKAQRDAGVDMMFDIYNELRGVSVITVILPDWFQGLSPEEKKKPLTRLKLRLLVAATSKLLGFGFKDIEIAYIGPGYERYEGKTVHRIAQEEHMSDFDAYLMLCEVSNFKGRVNMGPYTTNEIIHDFERNPNCLYITDAWVEEKGIQNPVLEDCFPRFLRDSLLGLGDTMPATVRRMTGATADRFRIPERGYLREGYYADLTVFDEAALAAGVPGQGKAFGIERVFINGTQVLDGDDLDTEAVKTSGRSIAVL
ncbi:MAG: amidohydrolase family protein [Firmicutes bacterium]|nr:amidohydrolase family protein [Bacillota bacterium]